METQLPAVSFGGYIFDDIIFGGVAFAETAQEQVSSRRNQLESELSKLEQEIGHQQAILDSKKLNRNR